MPGTSLYSTLLIAGAIIVAALLVAYLIKVWTKFDKAFQAANYEGKDLPPWTSPVVTTIIVGVALIALVTLAWNLKQGVTTNMSDYKSPAEIAEQKKILEAKPQTVEEADKMRSDQKDRAEIKPHASALESFDAKMKQEAEKIKRRSLGTAGTEEKTEK
jgi:hypothetical protein